MDSDFLKARAQLQSRMKQLEDQMAMIREELLAFERVEITMRRLANPPSGGTFQLSSAPPSVAPIAPITHVPGRGALKKLVLEFVMKSKEPVTASRVKDALLNSGYKPAGDNFDISVVKTLNNLAEDGVLKKIRGEKRRVTFALKDAK